MLDRLEQTRQHFRQHPTCQDCRQRSSARVVARDGKYRAVCRTCAGGSVTAPAARSSAPIVPAARGQAAPAPAAAAPAAALQPLTGYVVKWYDLVHRSKGGHNHFTDGPDYGEEFAPGAFRDFLAGEHDVLARINHSSDRLLGSTRCAGAGKLTLFENDHGLAFTLQPLESNEGQIAAACARAGSIHGVSPTWIPGQTDFVWSTPHMRHRVITRSALAEISLVIGNDQPSFRSGWAGIATAENIARVRDGR